MMNKFMKKASQNIDTLLGISHKSEDSTWAVGAGVDVSGHSLGASVGGGSKSGLEKSTKSGVGQGKSTKLGQSNKSTGKTGHDDDDDPILLASNTYSDAPNDAPSIGRKFSSFVKNGFSSMLGSSAPSAVPSGTLT